MKRAIVVLSLVLGCVSLYAQGWERAYGNGGAMARCVQQTFDGGYVATGRIYSATLGDRVWLVKTDATGDTVWTRRYDDAQYGFCVRQTFDGGYIVVGNTPLNTAEHDMDFWICRTDSVGEPLWTRTYGGAQWDLGYWVEQTSDSCYIVVGETQSFLAPEPPAFRSLWLLKLDESGDTLWSRVYWGPRGIKDGVGYCVREVDGGYVVVGAMSDVDLRVCIMKTDYSGDTLWMRLYGVGQMDEGHSVKQTADGGYIVAGQKTIGFEDSYVWLLRMDSLGDTLWTRIWGEEGSDDDKGYSVDVTSDGGYIVTGEYQKDLCLIKTDAVGTTEWIREFSTYKRDVGFCVESTPDGGYIVAGIKEHTPSMTSSDGYLWLLKTDSLGYVGVAEQPALTQSSDWEVLNPVGSRIVLRYGERPEGFCAHVFDATGRKVDQLESAAPSGTLLWGDGQSPGVYFIRVPGTSSSLTRKVVLVR